MKTTKSIMFAIASLGLSVFAAATLLVMFDHASAAMPTQLSVETQSIELVGQVGGSYKAIAVQGEYAYAAIGPRLTILDITDAAHPTMMGQTEVLPIDILGLVVSGGFVYAAAGRDGLFIFDTSNPSQPVFAASLDAPGYASSVAITGTHVFLTTDTDLCIVDVSEPAIPVLMATYPAVIRDLALDGNTLYLALGDKLRVLDISNPANPNLITDFNAPADDIEIGGNLAYIGVLGVYPGAQGLIFYGILRIVDISVPANITEVFFSGYEYPSSVPSQLREMKLLNHKLYGFSFSCGHPSYPCDQDLGGVDVSNPVSPTLAYTPLSHYYRRDSYWRDFAIAGPRIYEATTDLLHIYDTSTNAHLGQYAAWPANQVTVANGVAYVAAGSAGLLTIDVSAPAHPTVMDIYTTTVEGGGPQPAEIANITEYGPYIYARIMGVAFGLSRVDILDVSRNADIQRAAISDWYMIPNRIHNGYGYYITLDNGYGAYYLRGIDLGSPIQPTTTLGSISTAGNGSMLSLMGSYAYVTSENQGVQIINIADPQNFVNVKQMEGPVPAYSADNAGNAVYIFTDQALKIFDLSDPENPVESSSTPVAGLTWSIDMKVFDDYTYLIQNGFSFPYTATVRAFHTPDLISPASEVASYTRIGNYFPSIDVVGNWLYVGGGDDGLFILHRVISNPELSEQAYLPLVGKQIQPLPANCEIAYRTHLQDRGWLDWVSDGIESGAAGAGLRVEAIQVRPCNDLPEGLGIVYQAHVQDIGWMDWVYDGQVAGTTGQGKRLEAVRFKLLNAPDGYIITYRVYIDGSGWTGWVSDGEMAGTMGQGNRIESIQIDLVRP